MVFRLACRAASSAASAGRSRGETAWAWRSSVRERRGKSCSASFLGLPKSDQMENMASSRKAFVTGILGRLADFLEVMRFSFTDTEKHRLARCWPCRNISRTQWLLSARIRGPSFEFVEHGQQPSAVVSGVVGVGSEFGFQFHISILRLRLRMSLSRAKRLSSYRTW